MSFKKVLLFFAAILMMLLIGASQQPTHAANTVWLGEYYANTNWEGQPVMRRADPFINFSWNVSAPSSNLPTEFSVKWTRTFWIAEPTSFFFDFAADEGVEIHVDGQKFTNSGAFFGERAEITLSRGDHTFEVFYKDTFLTSFVRVEVVELPLLSADSWRKVYYNGGVFPAFIDYSDDLNDHFFTNATPVQPSQGNSLDGHWARFYDVETPGVYRIVGNSNVFHPIIEVNGRDVGVSAHLGRFSTEIYLEAGRHRIDIFGFGNFLATIPFQMRADIVPVGSTSTETPQFVGTLTIADDQLASVPDTLPFLAGDPVPTALLNEPTNMDPGFSRQVSVVTDQYSIEASHLGCGFSRGICDTGVVINDVETGERIGRIQVGSRILISTFALQGDILYVGLNGTQHGHCTGNVLAVSIADPANPQIIEGLTIPAHEGYPAHIHIENDRTYITWRCFSQNATLQVLNTFSGHQVAVTPLFSAAEGIIARLGGHTFIKIDDNHWNVYR